MSQITIDIPNAVINDLLDAFAEVYPIENRTKAQNARYQIRKFIRGIYSSYKTNQVQAQNQIDLSTASNQADIDTENITLT